MKGTIHKTKISPTEWEKIFASNISEGDKYPKYTKNLYNSKLKETKNQIEKWSEDLNRHFSQEDIYMCQQRHEKKSAQHH